MSWAQLSIDKRYAIFAASLAAIIFGVLAWRNLPIALFPDTEPPLVNVVTAFPGAAALDVEYDVSEVIEREVAALDGIRAVSSVSQDGLSVVTAEFAYDRNVDLVAVDVQNAVSRVRNRLPTSIQEPRVLKFSTSDKPVVALAVQAREAGIGLEKVRQIAENDLAPILQRAEGVAAVDVFGGARPQVNVAVDRNRLERSGLSLAAISQALQTGNITAPAGRLDRSGREVLLRFDQQITDVDELRRLPVAEREGQRILLGDVAAVTMGTADRRSSYRFRGEEVVALEVLQQDGANTVGVVENVTALIPELERQYPELAFEVAVEEASFTDQVVSNMGGSILSAVLLASIVIFLFIGSLRGSLIVTISMPMSFLLALAIMYLTGMELNLVTLSAVILAVGIVVDASVVVLENIMRHRKEQEDEHIEQAAVMGADEVFFAILTGITTTLIVLAPFLFLSGFVGQVFGPLATTMIYIFASSLLAAVTLIPLLAVLLLGRERAWEEALSRRMTGWFGRAMDRLREGYLAVLRWGLRHRAITLGTMLVLLLGSVALLGARGMEVLPRLDSGSFYISVEAEPGSSFDQTLRIVEDIEILLRAEAHVTNYTSKVGFEPEAVYLGETGAMGVQQAFMTVDLVSRKDRYETIWDIQDRVRSRIAEIPGLRTAVVKELGGTAKSTTSAPLNVQLSGPDLHVLDSLATEVAFRMNGVPGAVNVYRQWSLDQPILRFEIDGLRAAQYELTPQQIADETYAAVEGRPVTTLTHADGTSYPIVVRYDKSARSEVGSILDVQARPGLPLRAMATSEALLAPNLLTREELRRTADISGFHHERPFSHVVADIEASLEDMALPPGYELAITGENADLQETIGTMIFSLLLALVAVYLLLVAQFKSFVHPLTVMLAVPLVLVGVSAALVLAGKVISLSVLMALVLLIGIAVNNSIILLDFVLQARRAGTNRWHAVVDSVSVRFRPIMMTTFSTVIGMLPLALEWALGAERFSPMAIAIIGGLAASSLLTLVVIPVFYTVMDDVVTRLKSFTTSI